MMRRPGKPRERLQPGDVSPQRLALLNDGVPLLLLAMGLSYTGPLLSFVKEEALALNSASQPLRAILAQFWSGAGLQDHPPLYDFWMHLWLRLSGGAFTWLRAPSIFFFLLGLLLLSRAAHRLGGAPSATALLWLGALWPYGFHYGRLAVWYPFSFLLIAALTWAYLRFCESSSPGLWAVVCLLALVLVCVDYFAWFPVLLLGVDNWLRNRKQEKSAGPRLLASAAVLAVAYTPFWPGLAREVHRSLNLHAPWRFLTLNAGYGLYVLFASESVAPWIWRFGVPVALAIVACLVLAFLGLRDDVRRFLVFGGIFLLALDLLGILHSRQLLLVAPWFLLPIAVALCSIENRLQQRALVVSLLIIGGFGWYGTYARVLYATAEFFEPWQALAANAAGVVREHSTVISNSPQFFLYLTYALQEPPAASPAPFSGYLPATVRNPEVLSIDDWDAAGRPVQPFIVWISGASAPGGEEMDSAADFLDHRCGGRVNRYLVRDPAYDWKQRLFPKLNATPWRVEVHQYDCHEAPPPAAPATPPKAR